MNEFGSGLGPRVTVAVELGNLAAIASGGPDWQQTARTKANATNIRKHWQPHREEFQIGGKTADNFYEDDVFMGDMENR